MASKHLRELLIEDQEPFILKNYIDERRCQIKRSVSLPSKTDLQIKTRKPITESSTFSCKNACFFSFNNSPDLKKSPLFDFSSAAKSPCRNSNTFFLHIPSKTASLLLEAAMRIQKNSVSKKPKTAKNLGFGLFGSFFNRIASRKREIKGDEIRVSVKDILKWDSSNGRKNYTEEMQEMPEAMVDLEEKRVFEMGFSTSSTSRLSSFCSESNEEKSLDLETSSSRSECSEDMELELDLKQIKNGDFSSSPCRFVLQNSSSPSHPFPEFESSTRKKQVIENEEESSNCAGKEFEEEEEKEQNSPVSVLDPPFEDDDDDIEGQEDDGFELEHSFAIVQRTKQQLLEKLRRFERLAGLEPIELEKRITEEDEHEEEEEYDDDDDDDDDDDSVLLDGEKGDDEFIREVLCRSNVNDFYTIPSHMKRLVMDLVAEETEQVTREVVVKNVCKRLESWKEVESNTIDMMVEFDIKREADDWRKNRVQMQETAVAIELDIFGFLVEEFSEELTCPY